MLRRRRIKVTIVCLGPVKTSNTEPRTTSTKETLNGMMLRNGPNPPFDPEGNYMWMDGDGMIHGIRFKDGNATYVARFTQTARFKQQAKFKKAQIIKYGDLVGAYGLFATFVEEFRRRLDLLDSSYGVTTANTGLVYHGQRIMALEDFGQPHVIYVTKTGDLKTLGINNYNGDLEHWLSPHPKIDPVSGEMFNMGSLRTSPYCIYQIISNDGSRISDPVHITVSGPTYMHELCITEHYVIFQDLPLVYDPQKMETNATEWIFNFDATKRPRYGILARDATSEDKIQWFEYDKSFFVFHNANAWEETDGTIVLYCCNMMAKIDKNTGASYIAPAMFQKYNIIRKDFEITWPKLYKMTFDLNDTTATIEKISTIPCDFPKINPTYLGRKTQYVYASVVNDANKIISIVKFDLKEEDGNPQQFYPKPFPFTYGGEVVFVPKSDSCTTDEDDDSTSDKNDGTTVDEDDGYLITFVHDETDGFSAAGTSYVYVIDAKTMTSVAKIQLPSRVPYGFHAIFVTEEQLQNQIEPST